MVVHGGIRNSCGRWGGTADLCEGGVPPYGHMNSYWLWSTIWTARLLIVPVHACGGGQATGSFLQEERSLASTLHPDRGCSATWLRSGDGEVYLFLQKELLMFEGDCWEGEITDSLLYAGLHQTHSKKSFCCKNLDLLDLFVHHLQWSSCLSHVEGVVEVEMV